MAGERIKLEVDARESVGSAEARRLRATGFIPGTIYGAGKPAQSFAVHERELRRVLTGEHGRHAILDVVIDGHGTARHAVLKDYQLHPLRSRLLHVDLQEVRLDQAIQAAVAVELVGEPEGVKVGGVLTQLTREVMVEALPMAMPDKIELDISALEIGDSTRVEDLVAPEGAVILDDPDSVVAGVAAPRVEEEPEPEEGEEEEGLEGEEGAEPTEEGEAPAGEESGEGEAPSGESEEG
jgi:large subunit ribosomal protein L25